MNAIKLTSFSIFTMGFAFALSAPLPVFGPSLVQAAEIAYKPAVTGAPVRRVGAGSRGVRGICKEVAGIDESFSLQVLAPQSIGQTLSKQPTLYWSTSMPVSGKFLFTVAEDSREFPEPVFDKDMTMAVQAGIQALPLATYSISLKENVNYKWSVSLQCDTANPSLNIIASGMIRVVTPATDLEKSFKQAGEETLPYLYAEQGYWYDALISLANLIEKSHPNDQKWREERANLLKQGGLEKVAAVLSPLSPQ
jgi:Domain of Unknown Function (DUF928)